MAYQVLRAKDILQKLLDDLSRKPRRSSMFSLMGVLRNTILGKVDFEAVVDTWPHYSAIVLRPVDGTVSNRIFQVSRWVHIEDITKASEFLNIDGILPWKKTFTLVALSKEYLPVIRHLCEKNNCVPPKSTECYLQMYPVQLDQDYNLPPGYYIDHLKLEHASLINQMWEYGGNKDTEDQIRFLIEHFDTFCAYSDKGEPVSWSVIQIDDSAGMSVTLPQHRDKGLAFAVWKFGFNSCQQEKIIPYGVIVVTNERSRKLGDKLGCMRLPDKLHYVFCQPRLSEQTKQMNSKM